MNNVPRLDLSPKIKRPLSLKNPLDYLRLLYWVLFFPQAVRCYVEQYIKEYVYTTDVIGLNIFKIIFNNFKNQWKYYLNQPKLISLIIQSILVTTISNFLITILINIITMLISKSELIFIDIVTILITVLGDSIISFVCFIVLYILFINDISSGIILAIGFPIRISILSLLVNIFLPNFWAYTRLSALAICIQDVSAIKSKYLRFKHNLILSIIPGFILGILFYFLFVVLVISKNIDFAGSTFSYYFTVILWFICVSITFWFVPYIRLENWLFISLLHLLNRQFNKYFIPNTTFIPLPRLYSKILQWLRDDLQTGIENLNELLKYTMQFIPVITAVNKFLDTASEEQLIYYLNQLVKNPYNWDLIYYCSISFKKVIKSFFIFLILSPIILVSRVMSIFLPKSIDININVINKSSSSNKVRHLVAEAFWQLHEKKPQLAKKAFFSIQNLPHGQELFLLADIFSNLTSNHDYLNYIISVEVPKKELIRQDTWKVIKQLQKIAQDTLLTEKSLSLVNRSLASNRAIGSIEQILNNKDDLPELEKGMIIDILEFWKKNLLQNASKIGDDSTLKPSIQPYVIGDPVQNQVFVGRTDIIKQLEKIWLCSNQIQSVILYGHRRMGKTSILINISDQLGSKVKLAYINLNGLGDIAGVDEVFMAITDAISEILNIAPPHDQDLSQSPYRTFKRYLKQIAQNNLTEYSLIIALDEFETIENLIQAKKISSNFLGFLRSMMQLSPKIAFAFAGLHTLDEMTADYFQPFFASIIPIRVNFLSEGATRQLLANPNDEFLLDYQPEALDLIYQLTSGQPYLVQLIGFYLVGHYNDQFEMGKPRDPILTMEDVNIIINDSEFFKKGRYYFTGVWGQASHNAPAQQEILRAIAPYSQGLDILSIEAITGINQTTLEIALKTLERHDVIQEKTGKWSIIVELFRRWVEQEKTSNS
jgi:hypothetical protein